MEPNSLTKYIIRLGLARDDKEAERVLRWAFVVFATLAFFIAFSGQDAPTPLPDPDV